MADLLVPPFWDWSPSLIDDRAAAMVSTGSPVIIPGWTRAANLMSAHNHTATVKSGPGATGNGVPIHAATPYGPLWQFQGDSGTAGNSGDLYEFDDTTGLFQVGTGAFTVMAAFQYLGTNTEINHIIGKGRSGSNPCVSIIVNNFDTGDGSLILSIRTTNEDIGSATGLVSAGDYGVAIGARDGAGNTSLWWRGVQVASGTGSTNNVNNSDGISVGGYSPVETNTPFCGAFNFLIAGLWERALTNAEKTLLSFDPMILVRPDMAKLLPMLIKAPVAGGTWPHNPLGHPLIGGLGGPIG